MTPFLTTITPFWGRPEMLRIWSEALKGSFHPEVQHLVFFVGEDPPAGWREEMIPFNVSEFKCNDVPGQHSIAHYHDQGVSFASSEWVMKLDVDCLPNVRFFKSLLPFLHKAGEKDWFNCGMFYTHRTVCGRLLGKENMPLLEAAYCWIMANRRQCKAGAFELPAGSNFICRRKTYLDLGGSDKRFQGYGWEDYQQLYMLERNFLGRDPLSGALDMSNVTQRCRDEISRPKAKQLWEMNAWLCLLHHWHPPGSYRNAGVMQRNKQVLLDYIEKRRA